MIFGGRFSRLAWAAAFDDCPLPARDYAAQAGVSVATLYYWRKQLDPPAADGGFTPLAVTQTATATAGAMYLRLPGGVEVHGPASQLLALAHQLVDRA